MNKRTSLLIVHASLLTLYSGLLYVETVILSQMPVNGGLLTIISLSQMILLLLGLSVIGGLAYKTSQNIFMSTGTIAGGLVFLMLGKHFSSEAALLVNNSLDLFFGDIYVATAYTLTVIFPIAASYFLTVYLLDLSTTTHARRTL